MVPIAFHWLLLRFTGFYWVLLGFTWFYRTLLGLNGLLTEFYSNFKDFIFHLTEFPGDLWISSAFDEFDLDSFGKRLYWHSILEIDSISSNLHLDATGLIIFHFQYFPLSLLTFYWKSDEVNRVFIYFLKIIINRNEPKVHGTTPIQSIDLWPAPFFSSIFSFEIPFFFGGLSLRRVNISTVAAIGIDYRVC